MATFIVKITNLSQYDSATASITWNDATASRWANVYGKLKSGDNCIFLSNTDLLVGDYASTNSNVSVTFNNIKTVKISTDDLLKIHILNPETLTVIKRPPGPLLKSQIDVNAVYSEAVAKNFVSFYIVRQGKESALLPTLKTNDRVITIDENDKLIALSIVVNGVLQAKSFGNDYFKAKDRTLVEILALLKTAGKPNHIHNIERIIAALRKANSYKFPSFNDYYNIIHNKGFYSHSSTSSVGSVTTIDPLDHFDSDDDPDSDFDAASENPKNIILYGPPGTGKTFHSISHAISIIDNEKIEDVLARCETDRSSVKRRYNDLVDEGRIVFCTFHQSMSYEDFIEGIKPKISEEEDSDESQLTYVFEDGIFKKLCTDAAFSFVQQNSTPETEKVLDFSSEYDRFADAVNENLSNGKITTLQTRSGGNVSIESISQKNNIWIKHTNGARKYVVSKQRLSKISKAFPVLSEVSNIYEQFGAEIGGSNASAYWAVLNAIRNQSVDPSTKANIPVSERGFSDVEKKNAIELLCNDDYRVDNPQKYILIIDEINRGNVSQVFGELITLIEDDKRLGKDESLKAILPYTKENFGVPGNVYIIGTMNTADRSVEALDTALRRRFSFFKMLPKPKELSQTIDGIDLPEILHTLNRRLSVLKDDDHTIGHAWFWNVTNVEELKNVFGNKILPLLQEYFYNDYEKLGLVLGDNFFESQEQVNSDIFASFSGGNGLAGQYDQAWQFKLKSADQLTITDFQSLQISIIH